MPPAKSRRKSTRGRSSNSKKVRAYTEAGGHQELQEHNLSNQQPLDSVPKILKISPEVRLLIFSYLVTRERPFLIGRCQEDHQKTRGSPRDLRTPRFKTKLSPRRNERRHRPIQPPVTRICRTFRNEALPLWYSKNHFWLIHNEFEPRGEIANLPRRFEAWISQTRRDMFEFMQHISLCGYTEWTNRMIISIDLKNRRIDEFRHYSTFGDELPVSQDFIDSTEQALRSEADADALTALKAVLKVREGLFRIPRRTLISSPPMPSLGRREFAYGWEFDW